MGNSASLPSLESNGRPFGTERSPIFSLSRQIEGQTRSTNPVARLERVPGAGGRRRASRQEQDSGQRAQRGKRPEESRQERKADTDPSRRRTEAQARERNESRRVVAGDRGRAPQESTEPQTDGAVVGTFQSLLANQESQAKPVAPEPGNIDGTQFGLGFAAGTSQGQVSVPLAKQALVTPGSQVSRTGSPTFTPGVASSGSNTGTSPPPVVAGNAQTQEVPNKKVAPVPVAVPAPELSEAQEAQRSSQVMRQLRMQLNPGMRSAVVHLHPAELGRLSIKLRTSSGQMNAAVRAESEEALAILERHIPELEAAFADQGYGEVNFEFVLDKRESEGGGAWDFDRHVSAQLESRIAEQADPKLKTKTLVSDIGVDTYA